METKENYFILDGKKYDSPREYLSVAEIRTITSTDETFSLAEETDEPYRQLRDSESLKIKGLKLISFSGGAYGG